MLLISGLGLRVVSEWLGCNVAVTFCDGFGGLEGCLQGLSSLALRPRGIFSFRGQVLLSSCLEAKSVSRANLTPVRGPRKRPVVSLPRTVSDVLSSWL